MHYVRLRSAFEGVKLPSALPETTTGVSTSTRRLRFVKDRRYFKPYTFVGLKKTPKYLENNPFRSMFKRARRLLRISRIAKTPDKPKTVRSTSPLYARSNVIRGSRLIAAPSTAFPTFAKVKLHYKAKKSLRKFLKSRKFKLLKSLPKLLSNKTSTNVLTRLTNTPYRSLPSSLRLPSFSRYCPIYKGTVSPLSKRVLLCRKPGVTSKTSLVVFRSSILPSPISKDLVSFLNPVMSRKNRAPEFRHLWSLYLKRSFASSRASIAFATILFN